MTTAPPHLDATVTGAVSAAMTATAIVPRAVTTAVAPAPVPVVASAVTTTGVVVPVVAVASAVTTVPRVG
ncbi:hypothetical protein ACIPJG_20490, partial [Streptomyces halstedii]